MVSIDTPDKGRWSTHHPVVAEVLGDFQRRALALDLLIVVIIDREPTATEHVVHMGTSLRAIQ